MPAAFKEAGWLLSLIAIIALAFIRLVSDPPENCHLNIKKLPRT